MKFTAARATTYGVVALLAVAALRLTPELPARAGGGVAATGGSSDSTTATLSSLPPAAPQWQEREDTLGRGEPLVRLFERAGLPADDANQATRLATEDIDARRIPAGLRVTTRRLGSDSTEIVLQLALDRLIRLRRTAAGWTGGAERVPWTTDTVVVAGAIRSTLYDATRTAGEQLLPGGARTELAWKLADIYEYRVDMSRDLQRGDAFRAMVERQVSPAGVVRLGNVVAASFEVNGDRINAIRFGEGRGSYYDQQGKSLRAAFLRAPLEFRRISSVFGMRRHPILGVMKKHAGTDYAASSGTPVRAIGDGVVVRAGWGRGYGNVLEIRHRNGYVTRHGHLRGFARGIRVGTKVGIGETVAYVGSTGLSTAPHLHFEVLVGGTQRNPSEAIRAAIKGGDPIPAAQRSAFLARRDRLVAALDAAPVVVASR